MSSVNSCQLLFVSVLMVSCALPLVHAAEGGKVFTIANDEFGPVYRVDMNKVKSAADLAAVPGVKIAWDLQGHRLSGWLANADDWDDDGQIDLVFAAETNDRRCIIRYTHEGKERWRSEQINQGMGHESGMAVQDLDGDGKQEIIFNVLRQLWCIDFNTGKTKWKIDLPACRDNYQASVAGHFLSRNRLAVVCRVERNVTCYDAMGKMAWTCQIDNRNYYGHDMASYDADGDGLDEVYISLNGKFLCLGGDGKFRWSDPNCSNHSDFVLFGDVDGDGDTDVVYDRDGCNAMGGPIVCMDGKTARQIHQWTYARPGKDHIQRATLGDFDPSRSGLELAGVGKEPGLGGLMMWSDEGGPAWRKDIPAQWVTCGDWNGDGKPEIMTTCKNGWEVWAGTGKRQYAIKGVGELPLDVESAGRPRPDLDGNGRADVLLSSGRGYILLMEAP